VHALRDAGADRVAAVGGDAPALAALGLDVVADDHPGEGPLGGLISALRWAPVDPVVVLSCDLVALGEEEVRAVLERLECEPDADVAAPLREGQPQFLTGAYRRRCLGALEERFRQGERAVRRAVADCELRLVTVEGLGVERLADVDTPAELAAYRRAEQHPHR
jgi:molybdopterin-guanine dinucleotide biosynthesis protein A